LLKIVERKEEKQEISFDHFKDNQFEKLQIKTLSDFKPNHINRLDKKEDNKS
jgi:hypothetical protein